MDAVGKLDASVVCAAARTCCMSLGLLMLRAQDMLRPSGFHSLNGFQNHPFIQQRRYNARSPFKVAGEDDAGNGDGNGASDRIGAKPNSPMVKNYILSIENFPLIHSIAILTIYQ